MAQQFYKVARLTDQQIATVLGILAEEFGQFSMNVQVLTNSLGKVEFPDQADPNWKAVLELKTDLVDHFTGTIAGVGLSYYRGGHSAPPQDKSPVLDDIVVDSQGLDFQRVKIVARIVELFRPVQLPRAGNPNDLLDAQRAIQESTFGRLQELQEHLFEQTLGVRTKLDESVRAKEDALEATYQEKHQQIERELNERLSGIQVQQEELNIRSKQLDDSDNTFARRKIRDLMLSDVTDRVTNFGVSPATLAARKPVAIGMISIAVFFLILFTWTTSELLHVSPNGTATASITPAIQGSGAGAVTPAPGGVSKAITNPNQVAEAAPTTNGQSSNERIALWIRLSLVSLGFVASVIYYIKWQNQWATEFANTEHSLKQFHIDVNRANWVVETCLEWRKENQSDLPATVLESLTRGLFTDRQPAVQVLHPADELASALMGSASKLSLNVGGNTVEIDKPGRIPKAIAKSADATA